MPRPLEQRTEWSAICNRFDQFPTPVFHRGADVLSQGKLRVTLVSSTLAEENGQPVTFVIGEQSFHILEDVCIYGLPPYQIAQKRRKSEQTIKNQIRTLRKFFETEDNPIREEALGSAAEDVPINEENVRTLLITKLISLGVLEYKANKPPGLTP